MNDDKIYTIEEIKSILNKKIDLGTVGSLKEFVKDKILGEATAL